MPMPMLPSCRPKPPIPDVFNYFEFPDLRPPARDWAELPLDAISYILRKLNQVELLKGGVAAVCRSWRRVARDEPELWRRIDIHGRFPGDLDDLARGAVCLSAGQCEEFRSEYLNLNDDFLLFLAHRAPLLITLRLKFCNGITNEGFAAAITNFPLLEELELKLFHGGDDTGVFEHVARSCPRMKHITYLKYYFSYITDPYNDGNALAIANMPELRTLQLLRDKLTNTGLASIIDNCPHLEYLYLRGCRNITMDDDLRAKCARIKKMTLLPDSEDYRGDFETGSTFSPCWLRNLGPWRIAHDAGDAVGRGNSISHKSLDLDSYGYYLGEDDETSLKEYDRILEKSMRRYKI